MTLVFGMIIGYIVLTNIVGLVAARNIRASSQFLMGSGKMPMLLVIALICGSWEGAGSSIGMAQQTFDKGLYPGLYTAFFALGMVLAGYFIVPLVRRLGVLTLPELIGKMFGQSGRWVTSVVWLMQDIIVFAVQFLGGAGIFSALFGLPTWQGVVITLLGVALYMVLGGMVAAGWTNLMHATLMLVTAIVSVPLAMNYGNGFQHVVDTLPQSYFNVSGIGLPLLLGWFLSVTSGPLIHQQTLQAAAGARSEKEAQRAFLISAVIIMFYAVPFAILGVVAKTYLPESAGLLALPHMAIAIHPVFGGILLAGVMAAILSSAAPMLFSSAAIFINDIYLPLRPDATEKEKLMMTRISTLAVLLLGLVLALTAESILQATVFAFTFRLVIMVCIILPWIFGGAQFFTKVGGMIGIVAGVAFAMVSGPLFGSQLPAMYWALGGALAGVVLGSLATRRRGHVVDDIWQMMRKADTLEKRIEKI